MRAVLSPPKLHPLGPCLRLSDWVAAPATAGSPVPDEWALRVTGARDTGEAGLRSWKGQDRAVCSRGRGGAYLEQALGPGFRVRWSGGRGRAAGACPAGGAEPTGGRGGARPNGSVGGSSSGGAGAGELRCSRSRGGVSEGPGPRGGGGRRAAESLGDGGRPWSGRLPA